MIINRWNLSTFDISSIRLYSYISRITIPITQLPRNELSHNEPQTMTIENTYRTYQLNGWTRKRNLNIPEEVWISGHDLSQ